MDGFPLPPPPPSTQTLLDKDLGIAALIFGFWGLGIGNRNVEYKNITSALQRDKDRTSESRKKEKRWWV